MESKLKLTTELALMAAEELSFKKGAWSKFLKTAARIYKYPFHDQLLIYAQRPDATACATIDIWNKRMRRWVKRGAEGIALIERSNGLTKLKYVFDVSDTYAGRSDSRSPLVWEVREPYQKALVDELSKTYQAPESLDATFDLKLMSLCSLATEEFYKDYRKDIYSALEGSLLEELDAYNTDIISQRLIKTSVAYTVMERCGIDADIYFDVDDFADIRNFNTFESLVTSGGVTSKIAETVLRQIERTVKRLEQQSFIENNDYNREERTGDNNGDNVSSEWRLSDSGSGTAGGGESDIRSLRETSGEIPEGQQARNLLDDDAVRQAESAPGGDRPASERQNGGADSADGESTGRNGEAQSGRSDDLDRDDEQHTERSGRDSTQRDSLQLSLFPSVEEQISTIEQAEEETSSAFAISQEEIDYVLQRGSGFENGKLRINAYYKEDHNLKDTAAFLKKEYGVGSWTQDFPNGDHGSTDHDSKGLSIKKWGSKDIKVLLPWPKVARRIGELIAFDRYLTEKEKQNILNTNENRHEITLHAGDPDAPEWLSETGDVTVSEDGDTVTISSANDKAEGFVDIIIDLTENKAQPSDTEYLQLQSRINYHITDDSLGVGGQKAKYAWNVEAIRLLNKIEEENRLASAEEQEVLSKYVGWGGLPQAFDGENSQWTKEYLELKSLLTDEEYASARGSTLNAHYTSPIVIKAIYACLENMGFKRGNILEPACGVGNFFGLVPESMSESKLYGIELDSITGRIAKQLYQNANISVQGYEATKLPDSFFDAAVGNVPFGSYGVADKKYDKYHFYIHDFFFAKTLDKVRPGGIVAFLSSKGTMDKRSPEIRKYIAQRAEFLGAVRLPNTAFLANAGTEVTSDIIFLQKRDRVMDIEPDWVSLGKTEDGITVNSYFVEHPEMMLGTMKYSSRMYGNENETTCEPYEGADLAEQLRKAMENIKAEITEYETDIEDENNPDTIPADPSVRNFSYTVVDGDIYYRENSVMIHQELSATAKERVKGMTAIRDCARELITCQAEDGSDAEVHEYQDSLNNIYDNFTKKYGLLSSRANKLAFTGDSSYSLLTSLEVLDENGELERKADIFTKRTIRPRTVITHVDTAAEALAVSLAEKAHVDLEYMSSLTGLSEEQITSDLQGVIFRSLGEQDLDIASCPYVTADEYLSGNVRNKLKLAKALAQMRPDLADQIAPNIRSLEAVQPKDLDASEIDVRLGATWVPENVIKDFVFETMETPLMYKRFMDVHYSEFSGDWNIKGKSEDRSDNIRANVTYGTKRISGYRIIEETLNLRDVRIFDTIYEDGAEKRVFNKKETAIAQQKQEAIKEAFKEWIWKEPARRERLTKIYNERFNSVRPREYDGSHIEFVGMNPEIKLRKHQVDAVARILYGGNTLLAHVVGAGKTFTMTAAAMEGKRLGLCSKSLFIVPNHLTEQWGAEFLQLYPAANILVATKKDFETKNRKRFCARIATGDYDAVILGHSQFEKIPISAERQKRQLEQQIEEITDGIQEVKEAKGERYAIKQLEKTKKSLKLKLDKLNDSSRKDDVVTFEELGVDRLFVDEADNFKNLFIFSKMRNVAGLSQTEAQKSSDLFGKCRYLDELTEGHGNIFATGTPISNSMVEMYTMQRYLQFETLRKNGLQHFDCWASTFGETVTAIELAPEGTGYRAKTRFARFFNLPELTAMFKEVADIKTEDMLNLPVPKAVFHNVSVKPSEFQKDMVAELSERADKVRNRLVEPNIDNMLKITNDGRKLALDQRLINPMLPDCEEGKINACIGDIFTYWRDGSDKKLTQLVFCDLSTPHYDGNFNVYDDVKNKLITKGVPENEIAYIHDANTEIQKKELFAKVRSGQVRVLIGSTSKMGAGTNIQDKLIAVHHLDCPWRPRDLTQRDGRIIRQGNTNEEVHIFKYVTENTFDAYLYQTLENKQRFISQIMTSKSPVRSAEDIDETALSYAEVKALATGNPFIKEKMDLDIQVSKLKLLKANHLSQKYSLEDRIFKQYPEQIKNTEARISGYEKDIAAYRQQSAATIKTDAKEENKFAGMIVDGVFISDKARAGTAILEACKRLTTPEAKEIGSYMGFPLYLSFDSFNRVHNMTIRGVISHKLVLGTDVHGNISRLNNALDDMPRHLENCKNQLQTLYQQLENAKKEFDILFEKEDELQIKSARLAELNVMLNMDKPENEAFDEESGEAGQQTVIEDQNRDDEEMEL